MNFSPSINPPSEKTGNRNVSSNESLYAALQAAEGTWFDLDLSTSDNADRSFDETLAYITNELSKMRGSQEIETVRGGNGKPYQIRLTCGLKIPDKKQTRIVIDDEGQARDVENSPEGCR